MTTEPSQSAQRQPLNAVALTLAAVFVVFWVVVGSNVIDAARRHDFLNIYTGASLALEGRFAELHDQQVQLDRERELVASTPELVPFVRPHFYSLLLAPLSLFSYATAFWVWLALHALLLLGCWGWAARTFGADALIFGALYLPTALGIAHGQDGVFLLVIAAATFHLAERGREQAAGGVLALGLMKFHLLLAVPAAMLAAKRWKMLKGFCAVGASAVLISVLLGGFAGARGFVDLLLADNLSRLSPSPELMINLHSLRWNLGLDGGGGLLLSSLLVVLAIGLAAVAIHRAPTWRFLAATLLLSPLAVPHVYGYDAAFLLLPMWLVLFRSNSVFSKAIAAFLSTPLPFFCSLFPAPWPIVPAVSLLLLEAGLAAESFQELRAAKRA